MSLSPTPFDGNAIAPQTECFLGETHRLLIGGEWVEGSGELETRDPATGLLLARFQTGGAAEVDRAVNAARAAFEGPWGRMTVAERTALLHKLARVMDANATLLTELDVIDNGMPRFIAGLTTANCVEMIDYYAGAVMRIEGTTTAPPRHIAAETEALTYTLREPVGVAGQIVPWNVPLSTAILKLAPALAAGCTVVMKPSEETPLSALALGRMILEAGIPAGVVNIVNGAGAEAGQALAEHPGVDKISFTGSTITGKRIIQAALGNLKKVSLELGGKSPVVVMPDAVDLDRIGDDRHLARKSLGCAGLDVERAAMERTLDDVAILISVGQHGIAVGAKIVGNKNLAIDIVDGKRRHSLCECRNRLAVFHAGSFTKAQLVRHG